MTVVTSMSWSWASKVTCEVTITPSKLNHWTLNAHSGCGALSGIWSINVSFTLTVPLLPGAAYEDAEPRPRIATTAAMNAAKMVRTRTRPEPTVFTL